MDVYEAEGRPCDVDGKVCDTRAPSIDEFCATADPDFDDLGEEYFECIGGCWEYSLSEDCFDCCFGDLGPDGCPTDYEYGQYFYCQTEGQFCATEDSNRRCETIQCIDGEWRDFTVDYNVTDCDAGGASGGAGGVGATVAGGAGGAQ